MATGKKPCKKPSNLARWKDAASYDIRAKARNWMRFLKRDTAIVTPEEAQAIEAKGFVLNYKGKLSGARSRVKAVGVQAVITALRTKEDVKKVVDAIHNNDWTSVSRIVQPLGLAVDYTRKNKTTKKVLTNV